ncbi:hypothetical protein [Spirosoma litoris]
MKLIQVFILIQGPLLFFGCPRQDMPPLCPAPDSLIVDATCYKPSEGVTVRAVGLSKLDSMTRFKWDVFIFADSSGREYFDHTDITIDKIGQSQITIPDSLLKDNQKFYIAVNAYCEGVERGPGLRDNQFVKRFKKTPATNGKRSHFN